MEAALTRLLVEEGRPNIIPAAISTHFKISLRGTFSIAAVVYYLESNSVKIQQKGPSIPLGISGP